MKLTFAVLGLFVWALGFTAQASADWKNESEAGIVLKHGNSRSQSINAKHKSEASFDGNKFSLTAAHMRTKSEGVLSAKSFETVLRYERSLTDRLSLVLAQGLEIDRFAGIRQRYNTDIGPKYMIYKEEKAWEWFAEAGYRFTRENRTNGERKSFNKARVYTEVSRQWTETASSKLWVEYLPNFTTRKDWQFNTEFSTTANISSVFALKTAYLLKYDNVINPGARAKRDGVFTTALVAKF
jgi:putative salt-induced outer membrane protein YdiY